MALDTIIDIKEAQIYQKDMLVLSNVNLRVEKGEFVYLIGKTGSGKSSCSRLFMGSSLLKKELG